MFSIAETFRVTFEKFGLRLKLGSSLNHDVVFLAQLYLCRY